jgi:hypothetical protein
MPNGIYPIPPMKTREATGRRSPAPRPGIGLRLKTWWRRLRLDEQLAEGIDRSTSPELALRADQLGSAEERVRLAKALEATVREVSGPPTRAARRRMTGDRPQPRGVLESVDTV